MSSQCRYCGQEFTFPNNCYRHERNRCKVKDILPHDTDLGPEVIPPRPFVRPVEPLVEPPSPTETTETTEPETVESVEPETGEPTDLGSPTVHVDPKTRKKFVFDIFGDPMSPNTLAALDEFPESPTSPVKQEKEISDMDPWDEFCDRVKAVKLKDFRHLVNSLRKAGLSKKRARIRAYNEMLSELQKVLRQQYIDHLKWVHVLREDPIHDAILETRKKFQEEEGMDFNEAVEAAVNQRKYLLNRVFQPMEEPDTDEEDTDESPDESPDDDMYESPEEASPEKDSPEEDMTVEEDSPEDEGSSPKQFSQGPMGYIPRPSSVFVGQY